MLTPTVFKADQSSIVKCYDDTSTVMCGSSHVSDATLAYVPPQGLQQALSQFGALHVPGAHLHVPPHLHPVTPHGRQQALSQPAPLHDPGAHLQFGPHLQPATVKRH